MATLPEIEPFSSQHVEQMLDDAEAKLLLLGPPGAGRAWLVALLLGHGDAGKVLPDNDERLNRYRSLLLARAAIQREGGW